MERQSIPSTSSKKGLMKKLSNSVQSFDAFGESIGFNYRGAKTYQTFTGGLFTLLARILVLIYFSTKVIGVIRRETSITNTQQFIQTIGDNRTLNLNASHFDFALLIMNHNESYAVEDYDLFLNIRSSKSKFYYEGEQIVFEDEEFEVENCQEDRFLRAELFSYFYEQGTRFTCQKELQMELYRSTNSLVASFQTFSIEKCDQAHLERKYPGQNKTCKTIEEISQFISTSEYVLFVLNTYFDTEEFDDNPIKPYIYTEQSALFDGYQELKVLPVSQNIATVQDSWLQNYYGGEDLYFYQTNSLKNIPTSDLNGVLVSFLFTVDERVQNIERVRKNVIDSLSETGGIIEIIFLFMSFFLGSYQSFKHNSDLISQLYQIEEDNSYSIGNKKLQVSADRRKTSQNQFEPKISQDQKSLSKLMDTVSRRRSLKMNFYDLFCKYCACKKKTKQKVKLYRKGEEKLEKSLDIVEVLREVRNMTLVSKVLLSKYQKTLIPYFRSNLITNCDIDENDNNDLACPLSKKEQYLKQVILNSKKDKVDKKILKHLANKKLKKPKLPLQGMIVVEHQFKKNLQNLWQLENTGVQQRESQSRNQLQISHSFVDIDCDDNWVEK